MEAAKLYCWQGQPDLQELVGRRASFGAWAAMMRHRISLELLPEPPKLDRLLIALDERLASHGAPPASFVRCWLLDHADTYGWFADKGETEAERADARRQLAAARGIWRQFATV